MMTHTKTRARKEQLIIVPSRFVSSHRHAPRACAYSCSCVWRDQTTRTQLGKIWGAKNFSKNSDIVVLIAALQRNGRNIKGGLGTVEPQVYTTQLTESKLSLTHHHHRLG